MADERLDVIIKAVNEASKGLREIKKDLDTVDESAKKGDKGVKSLGDAFHGVVGTALKAGAAIGGVAVAMDQIFELGNAGAVVNQTGESFDRLTRSVGITGDLLSQLRAKTNGTVDDMTLMRSTLTLAAGSSEEMSSKLLNAAPRLAEIAKAANKLNPSLGDTTFFMDSLSLAVKRGSPLIADNLGILVKIGPANEAYAKSLGKTVEAMTAEERQMAFLNALLEKGDEMIKQVGGSTDSQTDAFGRLDAATKNLADAFKGKLAPVLAEAATTATTLLTWTEKLDQAFQGAKENITASAKSYDEYRSAVLATAVAAGKLTQAQVDAINAGQQLLSDTGLWVDGMTFATQRTDIMTEAVFNAKTGLDGFGNELSEGERFARSYAATLDGAATPATLAQAGATDTLAVAQSLLTDGAKQLTAEFIFQKASQDLDAEAALALGVSMGVLNEHTIKVSQSIAELKTRYDANHDGIISNAEATRGYSDAVLDLKNKVDMLQDKTIRITTEYVESFIEGGRRAPGAAPGRQHGGGVSGGLPYTLHPPEVVFTPTQTGFVMSQRDTQKMLTTLDAIAANLARPNVSIVNQAATAGGSQAMARALAGAW